MPVLVLSGSVSSLMCRFQDFASGSSSSLASCAFFFDRLGEVILPAFVSIALLQKKSQTSELYKQLMFAEHFLGKKGGNDISSCAVRCKEGMGEGVSKGHGAVESLEKNRRKAREASE